MVNILSESLDSVALEERWPTMIEGGYSNTQWLWIQTVEPAWYQRWPALIGSRFYCSSALLRPRRSFNVSFWGCSRTRCRDIDVTVFGVSTWNNGDVSGECSYLVSSGGAHCFTVLLHLSFSTSSGRRNIHVPFLCFTSWVPPLSLSRHSLRPGV